MKFNYSIGIFGSVSSGKSTLINSIFAKHLSQMNIRRTTMTPQVYMFDSETDIFEVEDSILLKNMEINKKFQMEIWDGKTINKHLSQFPCDFLPKNPNLDFQLYDLPGLNDQSTKHMYMKWAQENFHLFDCVILVIDIHSGLNTSDEIDICELIFSKMAEKKHVNLVVLVNKCDEMDYRDGNYIVCDKEKEEIYNHQVIPTLDKLKLKYGIENYRCNIIKFCSKNAFIYRTIYHNESKDVRLHLDEKHLHEMIQLEVLRSEWLRLSDQERDEKISCLIDRLRCDVETYERNMRLSGFIELKLLLSEIVNNPRIIEPFYQKIIREIIEQDTITREDCLKHCTSINALVLDDTFKAFLMQTVVTFYVENFYNHYEFFKKGKKKENSDINKEILNWFEDLNVIQSFEDYILSLPYMEKTKLSKKYFDRLITVFYENIGLFNNDILFCKIVDNYIIPSFEKYEISDQLYLNNLIGDFITEDFWNNQVFFDWAFKKGWDDVRGFLLEYITNYFMLSSKDNIYYLSKMVNQLRDEYEDVSILCETKKIELHSKIGFASITIRELNSFNDYDKKYGNFISYLIKKN